MAAVAYANVSSSITLAIYWRMGSPGVAVILYTDWTDFTEVHGKIFKKSV
jgi:hypothetical protein